MGFYDIIDDIANRQVTKTDTGDNRIFGVLVGQVTQNYSSEMGGRICVMIHTRDEESNIIRWARVAMPYLGTEYGFYFLPEVGDEVLVIFEEGNIEKPFVIGCIPKAGDSFVKKSKDENNRNKRIITRNGNMISILDEKEGEGAQDSMELRTAGEDKSHYIRLDNKKKTITLSDAEGKCLVEMKSDKGVISVKAEKKLLINVGDDISVAMNDGKITINAKQLSLQTEGAINMKAEGNARLEGSAVTVNGSGKIDVTAAGSVMVKGKPVMLG